LSIFHDTFMVIHNASSHTDLMPRLIWLVGALTTLTARPVLAGAPSWEFTAGSDYSTGRYGAESDTKIADTNFGARVQIDRLRLEAFLPLVSIDGPGELINGVLVGTGASSRRSGLGDAGATGAWLMTPGRDGRPAIEASASVKLPTAKPGIGTGKADYSLAANLYQALSPKVNLFASVGYSWLTDSAAYALSNGLAGTVAVSYKPQEKDEVGLSLAYRQPVAVGYAGQASLTPYWSRRLSERVGFSAYLGAGLTDASPRLGGGVAIKVYR
jgi:hypothetical protein